MKAFASNFLGSFTLPAEISGGTHNYTRCWQCTLIMPPVPTPSFTLLCLRLFFYALTLPCDHFIFTYPAAQLFYFHLRYITLLCNYFIFTYPAMRSFYSHLPCCAIIFLRTCSVRSTLLRIPCRVLIFLRTYPAVPTCCPYSVPCCALISRRKADVHEKKKIEVQQGKQKAG